MLDSGNPFFVISETNQLICSVGVENTDLLSVGREYRLAVLARRSEFADFAQCEAWGTEVFFAHPYTSWERSQNEHHNGLFRAFVPKGASMQSYSAEYILEAADELNARPRKKLGHATPEELFDAFLDRVYSVGSKPA